MEWFKLLDPSTSFYFYACPQTGQCSWKEPSGGKITDDALPTWWEMYDADSDAPYYFNNLTQETFWELPSDLSVVPVPLSSDDDSFLRNVLGPPPAEAKLIDDDEVELDEDEWEEKQDPRTGYNYFLHRRTRKMTWSKVEAVAVELALAEREVQPTPSKPAPAAPPVSSSNRISASPAAPRPISMHSRPSEMPAKPTQAAPEPRADKSQLPVIATPAKATNGAPSATNPKVTSAKLPIQESTQQNTKLAPPSMQRKPSASTPPLPTQLALSSNAGKSPTAPQSIVPKAPTSGPPPVPALPPAKRPPATAVSIPTKGIAVQTINFANSSTQPTNEPRGFVSPRSMNQIPSSAATTDDSKPKQVLQRNPTMPVKHIAATLDEKLAGSLASSPPAAVPSPFAIAAKLNANTSKASPLVKKPVLQKTPLTKNSGNSVADSSAASRLNKSSTVQSRRLSLFKRPLPAPNTGRIQFGPVAPTMPLGAENKPSVQPASSRPRPVGPPPPLPASLKAPSPRPLSPSPVSVSIDTQKKDLLLPSVSPLEKQPTTVIFSPLGGTIEADEDYGFVHVDDTADDNPSEQSKLDSLPPSRMRRVYSTVYQVSPVLIVTQSSPPVSSTPSGQNASQKLPRSNEVAPVAPSRPTLQRSLTERPKDPRASISMRPHPFPRPPTLSHVLLEEINLFQLEGFGKKYFRTAKKGLFRRLIPIRQLLQWSKDPPPGPLLRVPKGMAKAAIQLFRLAQIYMGDKEPQTSISERFSTAQELLEKCITVPEVRDELYCILCKQTCHNPSGESTMRGWELMCLCTQNFPPTVDLEVWLRSYIKESGKLATSTQNDKLQKYVTFCLKKLESICRDGARGICPDIVEIERAVQFPIHPPIFGGSLSDIIAYQSHRPELRVPLVCSSLVSLLDRLSAHHVEGIFRLPGSAAGISKLRLLVESQTYNFTETDPHVPASALKIFLRQLDVPLFPESMYSRCMDASKAEDTDLCCALVRELPEVNRNIVLFITKFLQKLARPENQKHNKMGIQNLAIVFAPCFFRTPSADPSFLLEATRYEQFFVAALLRYLDVSTAPSE